MVSATVCKYGDKTKVLLGPGVMAGLGSVRLAPEISLEPSPTLQLSGRVCVALLVSSLGIAGSPQGSPSVSPGSTACCMLSALGGLQPQCLFYPCCGCFNIKWPLLTSGSSSLSLESTALSPPALVGDLQIF